MAEAAGSLNMAPALQLPADVVTQTIAILAERRAGKSSTGVRLAEQMFLLGLPWVAIDPKGDWWGMRAPGTGPGLKIPVFGGLRGDLPLTPESGRLIAELITEQNLTCILDVSNFPSDAAQTRFLTDFARHLFDLHRKNPSPRHLFLEEADEYCMTADTEILTESGWATWDQIRVGTVVVAFDPATASYHNEPVKRVIFREHDGEMVHLKTKALDCLVTPDHRVVLQRFQHDTSRFRWYDWAFCEASKVPGNVRIPTGGAPEGPGIEDLDETTLRILGWTITDGFFHHRHESNIIGIEQSTATTKRGVPMADTMASVLADHAGTRISIRQPRTTRAPQGPARGARAYCWYLGRTLSDHLLKWLGDDLHRIPRRLLEECSRPQLLALYQGLMEGDGTSSGTDHWMRFYPGKNEALADDFQELATRLGVSSTKLFVPSNKQWHVTVNSREHHYLRSRPPRTAYKGMVWDITVPSGAFVARRNGRVFVTGNCPQVVRSEQARCVHAWARIVKQGGAFGLGMTLLSQRSAVVNKNVLSQMGTLIAMRTTSSLDRGAIKDWIDYHAGSREIIDSLPSLADGEGWIISPHWLARHGQPAIQRVQFSPRTTFDSGATPTLAGAARPPATLADIDLGALAIRMQAITGQAADSDPGELRKRIKVLEQQVATARSGQPDGGDLDNLRGQVSRLTAELTALRTRPPERVEVPVLSPGDMAALEQAVTGLRDIAGSIELALSRASAPARVTPPVPKTPPRPAVAHRPAAEAAAAGGAIALSKAQRAILTVLAQFPGGRTKKQVAMLSRYSANSGGFNGALASLRGADLIGRGDPVVITDAGREALGEWEPLPSGRDLVEYWLSYLSKAEAAVLRLLLDSWPVPMSKDAIAAAAGYSANSGGFNGALARLRTLQLITGGASEMYPDETLAGLDAIETGGSL